MVLKMEQMTKKNKIFKGFVCFLLGMWICTLIAKGVYASGLPRVACVKIEKKSIEHPVIADGIVKQGQEIGIHTQAGMRIKEVMVREGDVIEEGSVLFLLDKEDLEEVMEEKKLVIAKLEYQLADLEQLKALSQEEKGIEKERATEDYTGTKSKADLTLKQAEESIHQAESKLQSHEENQVSMTSEEERQKKRDEYHNWLELIKSLEHGVAEKENGLAALSRKTQEEKQKETDAIAALEAAKQAAAEAEEKLSNAQTPEETQEAQAQLDAANGQQAAAETAVLEASAALSAAQSEEEAARADLEAAGTSLEECRNQNRTEPDFSGEDLEKSQWESTKKTLEEQKANALLSKEGAVLSSQEMIISAERKIEDADTQQKKDSTADIYRMEAETERKELEKYEAVYRNDGKIVSSINGTVTQINIKTGERTPDTAAILCADAAIPMQFETLLTREQKKYVNQGDSVFIKIGKEEKELTVDYLAESESNPELYKAVVYLPEGMGRLLMGGSLNRKAVSDKYESCIPIAALQEENGRFFVYLMSEREGILGTEYYVEKKMVTVLDKNDRYAALEEGSIGKEDKVITEFDKELKQNEAVREKE